MSEKTKEEFKERRKAIMSESKHGVYRLSDEELKECDDFCEDYKKFLAESKIEREFVINAVELLEKNGFERVGIIHLASGEPRVAFEKIL